MEINSFSIIMALVLFTVTSPITSLFLSRSKSRHLWIIGLCLVLCFLRCILPIEFPGAHNVNIWTVYPEFFSFLEKELFSRFRVRTLICFIWLSVCLVLLSKQIILLIKQAKLNHSMLHQTKHEHLTLIAKRAAHAVHYNSHIHVYATELVTLPLMTGFCRPIILLPRYVMEMSDSEIEYILRHEIAHYKGGDNWYKLAVQFLTYFLWWNPAAYLMRRSINQWLELRSDNIACQSLNPTEKIMYSKLLIQIVKASYPRPKGLVSAGFVGNFDTLYLKQRLTLLSEKPLSKKSPLICVLIACVCIILFVGSYSFIVQPAYTPPEMNDDPSMTVITPENAWLIPTSDGKYEIWVDNILFATIPADLITIPPYSELPIK